MASTPLLDRLWGTLSPLPFGRRVFTTAVKLKAPYFRSIPARFVELEPGRAEVRMSKRWSVTNHLGTVHAIALCNLAELSGGLVTDISLPPDLRWIPQGMTVEYLGKADSDVRAVATADVDRSFEDGAVLPVVVEVFDEGDALVFRAEISMWVSPKRGAQRASSAA